MKKLGLIALFAVLASVAYVLGGPYIAAYNINAAVAEDDVVRLTENIDFAKLEKNIDAQFAAQKARYKKPKTGFFEGLFKAMADGQTQFSILIAGSPRAFGEYARLRAGKTGALFRHMRPQFISQQQMAFFVKEPEGNERKYIFDRHGISWKLTNIDFQDELKGIEPF